MHMIHYGTQSPHRAHNAAMSNAQHACWIASLFVALRGMAPRAEVVPATVGTW